jgi:hypothetical protein
MTTGTFTKIAVLVNVAWLVAIATAAAFGSLTWLLAIVALLQLEIVAELKLRRLPRQFPSTTTTEDAPAAYAPGLGGGASGGASLRGYVWPDQVQ